MQAINSHFEANERSQPAPTPESLVLNCKRRSSVYTGNMKSPKSHQHAFSLVEVLIAVAIMSLISLGMMSLFQNQYTELRAVTQKIAINEIAVQLQDSLRNKNFCGCLLRGHLFNTVTKTWTTTPASIPSGYSATPPLPTACTALTGDTIPAAGTVFPGTVLKHAGISWKDVTLLSGDIYKAKLSVTLDHSTMVRSLRDIEVPVVFKVNPAAPTAATFVRCDSQDYGNLKTVAANDPTIQPGGLDTPGKTGHQACADLGKLCVSVTSLNTIIHDAGCPGATHCMRICMTTYNQPLPGVTFGGMMGNVHDCSAQLGLFTTYLHVNVVRCAGWFSALCE